MKVDSEKQRKDLLVAIRAVPLQGAYSVLKDTVIVLSELEMAILKAEVEKKEEHCD